MVRPFLMIDNEKVLEMTEFHKENESFWVKYPKFAQ